MIQELADDIWADESFHQLAMDIERAWLTIELGLPNTSGVALHRGVQAVQAAAILAASAKREHRSAAYRVATNAFQLFGSDGRPLDQALNIILTRLGNFPARQTDQRVAASVSVLPLSLALEEVAAREANSILVEGREITLTDFQLQLWSGLSAGERVAVSAPTSAGKSFVLQTYLTSLFSGLGPRAVVYIVPTRALIAQVSEDVLDQIRRIDADARPLVVTVPPEADEKLPARAVYVMTQERVQLCLNMHEDFRAQLVVVDEAHNIADGGRGVLLQWVVDDLLRREPTSQVLFASPLVRNLELFKHLFGLENFTAMPSAEPTVAQTFIQIDVSPGKAGRIRLVNLGDGSAEGEQLAELELNQPLGSRKDKLVQIAARLGHGKLNIVYANGAAEAEKVAVQLADYFSDREPSGAQKALAELVREAIHSDFPLAHCVERGIGYHYSDIPTVVRRAVETAAEKGDIDFIVCTSTLLQGVNLPAKNIFMVGPTKGKGKPLQSTDFWNLAGRAGRLGREFQGTIFLIAYQDWEQKPLSGPKDGILVSALEQSATDERPKLLAVVNGDALADDPDVETAFSRLLTDLRDGCLPDTLARIGIQGGGAAELTNALASAATAATLPNLVVRQTPSISAHKQQSLYEELLRALKAHGERAVAQLTPRHPQDALAWESYAAILERCRRLLLGVKDRKHTLHALLAVWWARGRPLPQIVQERLNRLSAGGDRASNMRDTLKLVEHDIRFTTVRLFGCYTVLLVEALKETGFERYVSNVPALGLYLEVGAFTRTMISLMSLGLSRVAAGKLTDAAANKNMDLETAREWLRGAPLGAIGLSQLIRDEVERVRAAAV